LFVFKVIDFYLQHLGTSLACKLGDISLWKLRLVATYRSVRT